MLTSSQCMSRNRQDQKVAVAEPCVKNSSLVQITRPDRQPWSAVTASTSQLCVLYTTLRLRLEVTRSYALLHQVHHVSYRPQQPRLHALLDRPISKRTPSPPSPTDTSLILLTDLYKRRLPQLRNPPPTTRLPRQRLGTHIPSLRRHHHTRGPIYIMGSEMAALDKLRARRVCCQGSGAITGGFGADFGGAGGQVRAERRRGGERGGWGLIVWMRRVV